MCSSKPLAMLLLLVPRLRFTPWPSSSAKAFPHPEFSDADPGRLPRFLEISPCILFTPWPMLAPNPGTA